MRKLKLRPNIEELQVESFEVDPRVPGRRGTVHAAGTTTLPIPITIPPDGTNDIYCISIDPCVPSNEATCGAATCADTCWPTCHC